MSEYMSYDEALGELLLGRDELNELVANGELRAFHEGDEIRFKSEDVVALKKSRETEPTIVLSDTQADALSIGGDDEIPIDLDSLSTDETVLNIEGLLEDETEGTTPIPGAADLGEELDLGGDLGGDIGEDTVLDTEGLDLDDDFDLGDDDTLLADEDDTLLASPSGPRQVQMVKRAGHPFMTATLAATMLVMLVPTAVLVNLMMGEREGVFPKWISEKLTFLDGGVNAIVNLFG